jgi:hypothetical protein
VSIKKPVVRRLPNGSTGRSIGPSMLPRALPGSLRAVQKPFAFFSFCRIIKFLEFILNHGMRDIKYGFSKRETDHLPFFKIKKSATPMFFSSAGNLSYHKAKKLKGARLIRQKERRFFPADFLK